MLQQAFVLRDSCEMPSKVFDHVCDLLSSKERQRTPEWIVGGGCREHTPVVREGTLGVQVGGDMREGGTAFAAHVGKYDPIVPGGFEPHRECRRNTRDQWHVNHIDRGRSAVRVSREPADTVEHDPHGGHGNP